VISELLSIDLFSIFFSSCGLYSVEIISAILRLILFELSILGLEFVRMPGLGEGSIFESLAVLKFPLPVAVGPPLSPLVGI